MRQLRSWPAKRQFLPLQRWIEKQKNNLERVSKEIESNQETRLDILQKLIEADQELEAANSKKIQAKHEMAMLVAEQTAENAKTVNQGNPRFQTHTSGSISDQAAQQTVLSVFKSVLSVQSMGCHGVFETAQGGLARTEEDVEKISQVMAHTVRKLETGNEAPERGPKAHQQNGHRWPRSHQEEPVK